MINVFISNGFETYTVRVEKIENLHTIVKYGKATVWGTIVWRGKVVNVEDCGVNGWMGRTT